MKDSQIVILINKNNNRGGKNTVLYLISSNASAFTEVGAGNTNFGTLTRQTIPLTCASNEHLTSFWNLWDGNPHYLLKTWGQLPRKIFGLLNALTHVRGIICLVSVPKLQIQMHYWQLGREQYCYRSLLLFFFISSTCHC